jgi:hypothetical protein
MFEYLLDDRLSRFAHVFLKSDMPKAQQNLNSWQEIKGFDKSEIHDVFSIYLNITSR